MEMGILGPDGAYRNIGTVVLGGGVGGARMARALAAVVPPRSLTVVVNVGDDDDFHALRVCPDLDTVLYTLAGIEGTEGWGRSDDSFFVLDALAALGADVTFRLGDADLATCLFRTSQLASGVPLSAVTARIAGRFGVAARVIPVTDDPVRTRVRTAAGEWLAFQDYFVARHHRDPVAEVEYAGAAAASLSPEVAGAISAADIVVVAPSNPVLSIGPMLAVPELGDTLAAHRRVVAVSPFFAGRALKGPAAAVLDSMGLPPGNRGLLEVYRGLVTDLVVDEGDAAEAPALTDQGVAVHVAPTLLTGPDLGAGLARRVLDLVDRPG
jgi:LPPG:FO 2-phospho-L-lactate transferase